MGHGNIFKFKGKSSILVIGLQHLAKMEGKKVTAMPTQWRWDRFDARTVTSQAWAGRNCVGVDSSEISTHVAMQKRLMEEQNIVMQIIVSEIHQLLHDAAAINNMKYCCKRTNHMLPCLNNKDIR